MDAKSRMLTLRMLRQMSEHPSQARALGLTDRTTFRGRPAAAAPKSAAAQTEKNK